MNQPKKKLYRSRSNRMIAGVCAGLGDYFHLDPTWVRIIFAILLVAAGATFVVYLLLWLIVPLEPESQSPSS